MARFARLLAPVLSATLAASVGVGPDRATATEAAVGQPIGTNRLVSVGADGGLLHRFSKQSGVSATGRYVGFQSKAAGIAPGAGSPHHRYHAYLRDRQTGASIAVDVRPDGRFGNRRTESSDAPSVTADGRLVVFTSWSTDLAPGGRPAYSDVFIRDTATGTTTLVSQRGKRDSDHPRISADGSTVVFRSEARNLVDEWIAPRAVSIYRYDVATRTTTLISRRFDGGPSTGKNFSPDIAADGSRVAYVSIGNVVPHDPPGPKIIVFDAVAGSSTWVSRPFDGSRLPNRSFDPAISADGNTIVYESSNDRLVPGDTNRTYDVFAYDVTTDTTAIVSRSSTGGPANDGSYDPDVDADGTLVTFSSEATNLLEAGAFTERRRQVVVQGTGADADAVLISRAPNGDPGDEHSDYPRISDDGSLVTYESFATNLGPESYDTSYVWAYRLS